MKRKLLSLIALLAAGGGLAAWGYAQDGGSYQISQPAASGSRYAEPQRFQPPPAGGLTNQLNAISQNVVAEHGTSAASPGMIQQTGGLDWLLERKPSSQAAPTADETRATPERSAASPTASASQPTPAASRTSRGPAPVSVDVNAAKNYRTAEAPKSTPNGTTTTQFRPVQSRLLAPESKPAPAAEPRVASRPLTAPQPEPQPEPEPQSQPTPIAAPEPQAIPQPAVEFHSTSPSDQSFETTPLDGIPVLTAVSPQIGVAVVGPEAAVLGQETEYVVHVQNGGNVTARGIAVDISLPAWVKLTGADAVSGTARASQEFPGRITWTINDLASDDATELSLHLVATEARPISLDVSYATAPTTAAASIAVHQPKLELTLNGPSEIQFGEARKYTLSISNPGTGTAENVVLQLQPLSRSLEAGVTKEIGTLKAGERKAIEIELTAEEAGQMAVQASVTASGGLKAETQLTVHVRRAALAIEVAGPPQKFAGAEAAYQFKISNTGDATASDVALAAILPEGAELLDMTEGATRETGSLGWNVGALAPGDARIYQVICSFAKAGQNVVEIRAKGGKGLTASNSVRTMVEAIADLKLLVNDPTGPIAVGKDAHYEIRIVNRGSKAAENVSVKGYFSEGIEPESVDGALGKIDVGQALFEPIARIEAGEEIVLKIKARASAGGNHIFRAVVECERPETRLVTEETTRYFETTANAFGDTLQR